MKYALDTNVCVNVLRKRCPALQTRLSENAMTVAVPSIVRYELVYGARRSVNSDALEQVLGFLSFFPSLPFDDSVADVCGTIRAELESQGLTIGPYDLAIAATAQVNHLTLISHNVREFSRVKGLRVEDWEI